MTHQEIADLSETARDRMSKVVRQKWAQEEEATKAEYRRVQALCAEHTGHVYALDKSAFSVIHGSTRLCVLCGVQEPKAEA